MPEIKNVPSHAQVVSSATAAPTLLSSDEVVRAISSHVLNVAVAGQIRTSGTVNFYLVDSATGKVAKSVSSLSGELLSDTALPADALRFFKTPLGGIILAFILNATLTGLALFYQQYSAEVSQRETEQFVKQIVQSAEQLFLSHSEQAPSSPSAVLQ